MISHVVLVSVGNLAMYQEGLMINMKLVMSHKMQKIIFITTYDEEIVVTWTEQLKLLRTSKSTNRVKVSKMICLGKC